MLSGLSPYAKSDIICRHTHMDTKIPKLHPFRVRQVSNVHVCKPSHMSMTQTVFLETVIVIFAK